MRPLANSYPLWTSVFVAVVIVFLCTSSRAEIKAGYWCSTYQLSGCGASYDCAASSGVACPSGGYAQSKRGYAIGFHICVTREGESCDEVSVICYQEDHFKGPYCTGPVCTVLYTYTDGCIP